MYLAKKGNKVLTIVEADAKAYQAQGFDIVEQDGLGNETVLFYGHGKTVPYTKYDETIKELAAAKAKIAELEAALAEAVKPATKRGKR
jgi:hypothetical protein